MEADYGIRIQQGSKLVVASNSAYDFGESNFTVAVLFQTIQPGVIISHLPSENGGGQGGWFLCLSNNGAIKFSTNRKTVDGNKYHRAISKPTNACDGSWHSVAVVRQNGNISIFFDSNSIEVTQESDDTPPFNVSNSAQILIGDCNRQALQFLEITEDIPQFIGILEDISLWNRALSQAEIKRTMFNHVIPEDTGLVGFWEMNRNFADTSRINNPVIPVGSVSWLPVFHCIWAESINNYAYCAIDLHENFVTDYGAKIDNGGLITMSSHNAYNFGTGDFTVTALFQTTQSGTIISRKPAPGGYGNGGWWLNLKANGAIQLNTDDGWGYYKAVSNTTPALDGTWHSVAAVRQNGNISIFFDGLPIQVTPESNRVTPLDVSNSNRIVIGHCDQQQQQFVGTIEDITLWKRALSQDEIQSTRFNEVTPNDKGLVGFWKLDQNFDDASPIRNNGSADGSVQFVEAAHQAERQQTLKIAEGTSYLYGVALDKSKSSAAFPDGALVKVFRPNGTPLDKDSNTDDLFVRMNGNSVWAFAVKNPDKGYWKFAVECPTSTQFLLSIQTTPSKDVAHTIGNTLQKLYVDVPTTRTRTFSTLASSEVSTSDSSRWSDAAKWAGTTVAGLLGLAVLGTITLPIAVVGAAVVVGINIIGTTIAIDKELDFERKSDLLGRQVGIGDFLFEKDGRNSYRYFMYDNVSNCHNESVNYSHKTQIDSGTPYLYAVLSQNDNSINFPVGAILSIQAPDETNYDHEIQDENTLAITYKSSIHCLIMKNPQPGSWNISINAPEGVKFHCEFGTVPSKDVFDIIVETYNAQDNAIDQLVPPFTGITDAILIGNTTDDLSAPAKDFLSLFTTVVLGQDSVSVGSQQIPLTPKQRKQVGENLNSTLTQISINKRVRDEVKEHVIPIVATTTKKKKSEKIPALVTWNMQGANWDNSGTSPWDALARWFREGHDENNREFPYKIHIACLQECGSPPRTASLSPSDSNNGIERYFWQIGTETRPLFLYILFFRWDQSDSSRVNLALVSTTGVDTTTGIHSDQFIPGNYRPLIGIKNFGTYFFSLHAASGNSQGGDAWALLRDVQQQTSDPWWVAGDYNQEPNLLTQRLNDNNVNGTICPPSGITRPSSGRKLDYAVREHNAQVITGDVPSYDAGRSDHLAVFYRLDI